MLSSFLDSLKHRGIHSHKPAQQQYKHGCKEGADQHWGVGGQHRSTWSCVGFEEAANRHKGCNIKGQHHCRRRLESVIPPAPAVRPLLQWWCCVRLGWARVIVCHCIIVGVRVDCSSGGRQLLLECVYLWRRRRRRSCGALHGRMHRRHWHRKVLHRILGACDQLALLIVDKRVGRRWWWCHGCRRGCGCSVAAQRTKRRR